MTSLSAPSLGFTHQMEQHRQLLAAALSVQRWEEAQSHCIILAAMTHAGDGLLVRALYHTVHHDTPESLRFTQWLLHHPMMTQPTKDRLLLEVVTERFKGAAGRWPLTHALLEAGARDDEYSTVFIQALTQHQTVLVDRLLEQGADLDYGLRFVQHCLERDPQAKFAPMLTHLERKLLERETPTPELSQMRSRL